MRERSRLLASHLLTALIMSLGLIQIASLVSPGGAPGPGGVATASLGPVDASAITAAVRRRIIATDLIWSVPLALAVSLFNMTVFGWWNDRRRRRAPPPPPSSFVDAVGHEMRNAMFVLRGYSDALADGAVPASAAASAIDRELATMQRLTEDLAVTWEIERGAVELRCVPLHVGTVLNETGDRFRALVADTGTVLQVDVPPALPTVWADSDRVRQVITNLVLNAFRHAAGPRPSEATIRLRAEAHGDVVRVSVTDDGPGLSGDRRRDLAALGIRGAGTARAGGWRIGAAARSEERNGSRSGTRTEGIGLVIVVGLVQAMGGEVSVASRPGQGTTFSFTLPTAKPVRPTRRDT